MGKRDGYDVAWIAVVAVGILSAGLVGTSGLDGTIDSNEQVVLIAALGSMSTIAGAALGYQVGNRVSPSDSTPNIAQPPSAPDATVPAPTPIEGP